MNGRKPEDLENPAGPRRGPERRRTPGWLPFVLLGLALLLAGTIAYFLVKPFSREERTVPSEPFPVSSLTGRSLESSIGGSERDY